MEDYTKTKRKSCKKAWVSCSDVCVVVQFYPWFKFYFLLFLGMVMYDNEFETKEYKIQTKDKIEPQHMLSKRF